MYNFKKYRIYFINICLNHFNKTFLDIKLNKN